jgi:hypothetical protein
MRKPNIVTQGLNPYIITKIRRKKYSKGVKIALVSLIIFSLTYMSMIPLGNAVIVKGGEFNINLILSERVIYEGKPFQVIMELGNISSQVQLVNFEGACQATFNIVDESGEVVYPRSAEETPCNNTGYEKFLIYPSQKKTYKFVLANTESSPLLRAGKYYIEGTVEGFGSTNKMSLEVIKKPDFFAKEFELCEGLTGSVCGQGLACKHRGGFGDGAGICLAVENNFSPVDKCMSGIGGCFNDIKDHPQEELIDKYALLDRISGFDDGTFRPDEPMTVEGFKSLVSKLSGKQINIVTNDAYIHRDTAVAVLYKVYLNNKKPRSLVGSPFIDINNSKQKDFIDSSYNSGLLSGNTSNKFYPFNNLSRAHALALIEKFENYKR